MLDKITEQPGAGWNESEAIQCAKNGDASAFEYLYNTHSKRVFNVCLRMLKNTAEAEDLTQQVFLRLFRKISTFRGDSRLSTWLHRVTVNAVLMHLRRNKKSTEGTVSGSDQIGDDSNDVRELGAGDNSMLGALDRLNLRRAIRQLPSVAKRLFLLHDLLGYRHSEIANLLGCSAGSSKSQVHRARKRLRHLLQGEPWEAGAQKISYEEAIS